MNVTEKNMARAREIPVYDGRADERYGGFESDESLEEAIVSLRKKGYNAFEDYSGACQSDAEGHYHPHSIKIVRITPAQARRLTR